MCGPNCSRSQWPRGLRRRSAASRLLRLWDRIPPGAWMFVCCECCVLSGLCDGLITRPEESYRLCCFVVYDLENLKKEEAIARHWAASAIKKVGLIVFAINFYQPIFPSLRKEGRKLVQPTRCLSVCLAVSVRHSSTFEVGARTNTTRLERQWQHRFGPEVTCCSGAFKF